jgi:hypothetical protein
MYHSLISLADEDGAEVGEVRESDYIAAFILKRADDVMESWQVANALMRMSAMIPMDKERRKKLTRAAEYVIVSFVDNMAKDGLKEIKEVERGWKEDIDRQDNAHKAARALDEQKKENQEAENAEEKVEGEAAAALVQVGPQEQQEQQAGVASASAGQQGPET